MTTERSAATAVDLMNRDVRTLTEDLTLSEAINFFLAHEISCAPVVRNDKNSPAMLVGFLTEKDCLTRIADECYFGNPRPVQTVATSMQRHPLCVSPDMDVFSLVSFLASHGLRHAPVTDPSGKLIGIISRREILRAVSRYYDQSQQAWQFEHFPPDLTHLVNLRFFRR